jgi:hypothetical protein
MRRTEGVGRAGAGHVLVLLGLAGLRRGPCVIEIEAGSAGPVRRNLAHGQ